MGKFITCSKFVVIKTAMRCIHSTRITTIFISYNNIGRAAAAISKNIMTESYIDNFVE
jgi:hypothetical protein